MNLISIVASILIFGLVIMVHECGHFIAAKRSGIKVLEFAFGMGPQIFKKQFGETVYSLRLFPIGGFVSMEGEDEESDSSRSFNKAPIAKRMLTLAAGALMNFLLGIIVLCVLVNMQDAITSKTVSSFYENSSTQASGLQIGDEIISVNGRRCFIADDIIYEFYRTQDGTADIMVRRGGEKIELQNVVFETYEDEEGQQQLVIDFTVEPVEKNFFSVLKEAFAWTISLARMIFLTFVDLLTGNVAVNELSGPVGIVSVISSATRIGLRPVLLILALITINLGVFNLLPLPALDGGRLVFLFLEMVRGKPVNKKYEIFVNAAGFIALMGLMLFTTFNDITKLFK